MEQSNNILKFILKEVLESNARESKEQNMEATTVSNRDADGPTTRVSSLLPSFCEQLLEEDVSDKSDDEYGVFKNIRYPNYPLHNPLSEAIGDWVNNGKCLFTSRLSMPLLNEESSKDKRECLWQQCQPIIEEIEHIFVTVGHKCVKDIGKNSFNNKTSTKDLENECQIDSERQTGSQKSEIGMDEKLGDYYDPHNMLRKLMSTLLDILGERGIMHLLGIRETTGSVNVLPPPFWKLFESFTTGFNVKSKLTVGARALSKHFHRCKNSWWGECTGSEEEKNQHAVKVLKKLLDDCVWINMHALPHEVFVIELRCTDGYGARWTSDGEAFRGFLEPQMDDGHTVGWRH